MKIRPRFLFAACIVLLAISCNSSDKTSDTNSASDATKSVGQSGVKDDFSAKNVVQVAMGSKAIGTMKEFGALSAVKEHPGKYPSSKEMIKELLEDHETLIIQLRSFINDCSEKYKDAGTADLLTGLMEEHETMAWTLRRYLN